MLTTRSLELTEQNRRVLRTVHELTDRHGCAPSVKEIGTHLGLSSTSTVASHLERLERMGLITFAPSKPRARALTEAGLAIVGRHPRERMMVARLAGLLAADVESGRVKTAEEAVDWLRQRAIPTTD